jgi:hypothetical protein
VLVRQLERWHGERLVSPSNARFSRLVGQHLHLQTGGSAVLKMGATIPAGGTSGPTACWKALGTSGWSYKDKAGTSFGITKVLLKGGAAGKPLVKLAGAGATLSLPAPFSATQFFDEDTGVIVQLSRTDSATCWSNTFTAPGTTKNTGTEFKAKSPFGCQTTLDGHPAERARPGNRVSYRASRMVAGGGFEPPTFGL